MTKPKNKYKRFFTIISMLFLLHQLVAAQSNFWIQVDQLLGGNVKSFTFNKNNNIITGVKSRGIFKSADAGKTWLPAGLQNISISVMKINSSNEIFYAGTESDGLYYSKDNGDSWQLINSDLSSYFINCIEFD